MKRVVHCCLILAASVAAASANAITYANDPTGNSIDFAEGVSANGGSITTYTFDDLVTGTLNPDAYAGLTLNATGAFTTISYGTGPEQSNTTTAPLSDGEGSHPASNYLGDNVTDYGTLTVDFATPVPGAGIFTIDAFNPGSDALSDNFSLSAWTGANGTGTLLGTATGAQFNFQPDYLYFLGIVSEADNIGSIVFSQDGSLSGDVIGLDNLEVASASPAGSVTPEPDTSALLCAAGVFLTFVHHRRRAARRS
jgi:hypothetical protein